MADYQSTSQCVRQKSKKNSVKVVLLGDMGAGKTALVERYINRQYKIHPTTIVADQSVIQWGPHNIIIWDTAGQEKFYAFGPFYCRDAAAAILVFDITDRGSFETIMPNFLPLADYAKLYCLKVVVGTKLDLLGEAKRAVTRHEAEEMASAINPTLRSEIVPYFETSSKTGEGVDDAFNYLFNTILPLDGQPQPALEHEIEDTIDIGIEKKKKRGCCSKP